jgi:hypothetical protein
MARKRGRGAAGKIPGGAPQRPGSIWIFQTLACYQKSSFPGRKINSSKYCFSRSRFAILENMRPGKEGLRPLAMNAVVLLLLFLNQTAFPLFSGPGSSCTCQRPGSPIHCCAVNRPATFPQTGQHASSGMICYCRPAGAESTAYRQGCFCGRDRESNRPTPLLPIIFTTESDGLAEGYLYREDPGRELPGFESPPIKPPPASRQI